MPILRQLLAEMQQISPNERALIAIDGVDGVGKTHVSQELARLAVSLGGRPIARVSIDGFHLPKADRLKAGLGPQGFFRGSYRYDTFRECVVEPVWAGDPMTPGVWDVALDEPVAASKVLVPSNGIVLVDGIFLQRSELADVWDAVVWVEAPFSITVPRGNARFPGRHDADPDAPSNHRYVGGQRLYIAEADPRESATWVLDNSDLEHPILHGPLEDKPV